MSGVGLRVVENERLFVRNDWQVLRTGGVVEDDWWVVKNKWRVAETQSSEQ